MIYVISKSTFGSYNVRDIQCNANWDCCPYSDYAIIPDDLVEGILATQGYCDVTLDDTGTEVVSFEAREIPSVPQECCGVNTVLNVNGVSANSDGTVTLTPEVVGAAPAGRGLEGSVQTANLDDIHANGWYQCGTGTVGAPTGHRYVEYGTAFVINRWGNHTTQLYVTQPSDVVGSPLMLVRSYKEAEGTWSPWEWINPPMALGVEYRTTERHDGQPVYTKLINCGVVTAGTTIAIDTAISVIRFAARSTNKVAYPFATPGSDYHRSAMVSSGGIEFACGAKALNTDTVYCQIWYTK